MRHSHTPRVIVLAAVMSTALTSTALASGSTSTGGGGGGTGGGGTGGGSTVPAPTPSTNPVPTGGGSGGPCVQVGSFTASSDQSTMTADAALTAAYQVSRCGGTAASYLVQVTADDAAGNRVLSATDTWVPNRSLPFNGSHTTDSAAFASAYKVVLTVSLPDTGAVVATATATVATPAARIAACASITNLGGTAGYYPGNTQAGALWLSWSVRNCGGLDGLDVSTTVLQTSTGQLVRTYLSGGAVAPNGSTGVGLLDVEPVPTGDDYTVEVQVRHHSDGQLLDDRVLALTTPLAK